MRLVNRQMLEICESCVKPIAEIDRDIWKVSLDKRIGQNGRFFLKKIRPIREKNANKVEIVYKTAF